MSKQLQNNNIQSAQEIYYIVSDFRHICVSILYTYEGSSISS